MNILKLVMGEPKFLELVAIKRASHSHELSDEAWVQTEQRVLSIETYNCTETVKQQLRDMLDEKP